MRRVLRPGGFAGIRDADNASEFRVPETELGLRADELITRVRRFNGVKRDYPRNQRQLLIEAGFARTEQTGGVVTGGTDEVMQSWAPVNVARFRGYATTAIEQGWTDEASVELMAKEMLEWFARPDAFLFHVDLCAIGFVDPEPSSVNS